MKRDAWQTLGMTGLVAVAAIGISGARVTFPSVASAEDLEQPAVQKASAIWTTPKTNPPVPAAVPDNALEKLNSAFTNLAEQMSPTVVNIYTKTEFGRRPGTRQRLPPGGFSFGDPNGDGGTDIQDFFGGGGGGPFAQMQPREAQALGSGFVLNEDGYIVTNAHVVRMAGKNADEIMIKFGGEDNSKGHKAKVVGVDEFSDVALLKLVDKRPGLKAAPLGDSDKSKVGEWVVAIGNPYGHTNTLTQGIVSALGRSLEGTRTDFMQTSATINPGNSGGPLFNLKGEVIGINTAIDPRAQAIGFAIPINTAKNVISQLVDKGHVDRPWMGVAIQDVTEDIAGYMQMKETDGVLVKEVVQGQPADKAGIKPYDVIRKINGKDVKNTSDLMKTIGNLQVGKSADIEVLRGSQTKDVKVLLAEQPEQKSQS